MKLIASFVPGRDLVFRICPSPSVKTLGYFQKNGAFVGTSVSAPKVFGVHSRNAGGEQ
jgi:hypothetical protein